MARKRRKKQEPRRPWATLAALVGASGLLATVTGLVVTRSFDPLSDGVADVVDASPLVVYYETDPADLPGSVFAFDHPLPRTVLTGPTDSAAVAARLAADGAVPIGQSSTSVTIENARTDTVVLTSIKAQVRGRTTEPAAALVVVGPSGGSGEGPVELHFNLDGVNLDARGAGDKGAFLDEHGLTLAPKEKLRFRLIGHATTGLVDWVVRLDYIVNRAARTLDMVPGGRPMRVTGASATYAEAYTWDASGLTRAPLTDFCPTDCRDNIRSGPGE